jgi:intracellular sulfur oxidation DsrE/DsrF family protein
MAKFLLIESRDPFESNDVRHYCDLAEALAQQHQVTLFLVQNAVLAARPCERSQHLAALAKSGVRVCADDFSLRERGIPEDRLADGIEPAPMTLVIDHMAEGCRTLWH